MWLVGLLFGGCIGTDYVDDPVVGEKILVSHEQVALAVGGNFTLMATYFDKYGIEQTVPFAWTSSKIDVAVIDESGFIMAIASGQSVVQASFNGFLGPLININVIANNFDVAIVTISAATTQLAVGQQASITAVVENLAGQILIGKTIEWFSENEALLTVDNSGVVTGTGNGIAAVHAKVDGVKSNSINFTIGGGVRSAPFQSAGGYQAVGTATLTQSNGQLILTFSDDFKTSFALGTYIYLANATNGSVVRSTGFEIAQITTNGAKTFNISQLNPAIGLNDYRYIIILCKPASVTFGFADLN